MSYLLFKYDPKRDEDAFMSALAFLFLKPRDSFKKVPYEPYNVNTEKALPLNKMVCHFAKKAFKTPSFVLQTKLNLETDKHLIESYGDQYQGYISRKFTKQVAYERLLLEEKCAAYDKLKDHFVLDESFFKYRFPNIVFASDELQEVIAITNRATTPVAKWIDAHSKKYRDELKGMPPIIMRNF